MAFLLFLIVLVSPFPSPASSWAAASYEESLKQLAEGVTEGAAKSKKQRLAVLDFTDSHGHQTPIGQFLAEELGTQVMVAGELASQFSLHFHEKFPRRDASFTIDGLKLGSTSDSLETTP
jgi:hypothetical protein